MKPTLDCPEIQAQLPLYVGGDLEAASNGSPDLMAAPDFRVERIRRHLIGCSVCAGELARLRTALGAIAALRAERLPEIDVWGAVRVELDAAGLIARPVQPSGVEAQSALARTEDVRIENAPSSHRVVAMRRAAPVRWRRVAAAIAFVGLGAALWSIARRNTSDQVDSSPIVEQGGVVRDVALNDTPGASTLAPTLIADPSDMGPSDMGLNATGVGAIEGELAGSPTIEGGLHRVGADEMALWRQAQRFGTPTAVRRANGGWQAASYPVYDPRVR